MNIRRYVVTIATTDDVDDHVSAKEIADCLSDYINISYSNIVECYRISDLQVVDSEAGLFTAVPEQECPEKCTAVQESTPVGVPEPEVVDAVELTREQQAILDAPQHAELPAEQPVYGEADGAWPPLDVSKLDPPATARWVAVDKDGRAFYYADKPQCVQAGWYSSKYHIVGVVPGRYDASYWRGAIWPVNLDSTQTAELPAEQGKYPPLDVSKLNPPADARWVAVDKSGLAYYYEDKPHCTVVGWCATTIAAVPGRYDASNWQEAIWPVNLEQGS